MNTFKKFFGHLHTINKHKVLVFRHCFRAGICFQGIKHDLSKYSLTEFVPGVKYYTGTHSPNEGERKDLGYSLAWIHHKGRNKHHFEYWIDYPIRDKETGEVKAIPARMPNRYIVEMFMDRLAACKTYQKEAYTDASPLEYYQKGDISRFLHPKTQEILERLLKMNAKYGEEYTIQYIKAKLLRKK